MARHPRPAPRGPDPFDPLDGRVDDTLDLHGFTAAEARTRLDVYFKGARQKHPGQLVHLITGKGRNSAGRPVLKPAIRSLLRSGALPNVASWGVDEDDGGYLVRVAGGRTELA